MEEQPYSALVVGTQVAPATWAYEVHNTSSSAVYGLWLVAIEVDEATDPNDVVGPAGWGIDDTQPHFVTWINFAGEIAAGASESGFQIVFNKQPDYQLYSVMFANSENAGETPVDFGSVMMISAPEPSSALALVAGALSLGAFVRRRRRG